MTVGNIMNTNLICISPFSSASEASSMMIKLRVRRLLVVDNNILVGIVTHNDLPQNISSQLKVKDVMAINPVKINQRESLVSAKQLMYNLGIGSLPVVDDFGRAVGIITNYDLNQNYLLIT